jgi:hypothetical protein
MTTRTITCTEVSVVKPELEPEQEPLTSNLGEPEPECITVSVPELDLDSDQI